MNRTQFESFIAKGEFQAADGRKEFQGLGALRAFADMARSEILSLRQKAAATAPATQKPASAAPAAKVSTTPHLDKLESLKGAEATAYFAAHKKTIRLEQVIKANQ